MSFEEILVAAAGREAAEHIQSQMREQGLYLTGRENLELRFDKMKAQRDDLLREKTDLTGQLARQRADFQAALQERQVRLDAASKRLADRVIAEEIAKAHPKNAAVVQALVTAGGIQEPDENGGFPEVARKIAELMHDEPYLFEKSYEPRGGSEDADPSSMSDAEYFSRMAGEQAEE